MAKKATKTETTKPAKPVKTVRTAEKRRADILRMVAAASAARSLTKVPTITVRVTVALKDRMDALCAKTGETIGKLIERAIKGLE